MIAEKQQINSQRREGCRTGLESSPKLHHQRTFKYLTCWISQSVSSVAQSCPTLCDPTDCSTPGLPVHHQLPEFTQTHVHWVDDAIQPPHPLSSPSPPAFNLSRHQGLLKWVSSSHQVANILEFQLQHQSYIFIYGHVLSNLCFFFP